MRRLIVILQLRHLNFISIIMTHGRCHSVRITSKTFLSHLFLPVTITPSPFYDFSEEMAGIVPLPVRHIAKLDIIEIERPRLVWIGLLEHQNRGVILFSDLRPLRHCSVI